MRVHGLADARRAVAAGLAAGGGVTLLSATGAASYAGCAWWRALVRQSGTPWPDILDCADATARLAEAVPAGQRYLVLTMDAPGRADAVRIAEAGGARVLAQPPPALDLLSPVADRALGEWLARP